MNVRGAGKPAAVKDDVFVSYRRADSAGWTGRLVADLRKRFPDLEIFMDLQAVPAGRDFRAVIDHALTSSRVVLVVIGPHWLSLRDAHGAKRLSLPGDLVQIEVARALALAGTRVIPVLVGEARMPKAEELPEALLNLARLHALELSDSRWEHDLARIAQALEQSGVRPGRRRIGRKAALATIALGAAVAGAIAWHTRQEDASASGEQSTITSEATDQGLTERPDKTWVPPRSADARPPNSTTLKLGAETTPDAPPIAARPAPAPAPPVQQPSAGMQDVPDPARPSAAFPKTAPVVAKLGGLWAGEYMRRQNQTWRTREMLQIEVEGDAVYGRNWVEVLEEGSTKPVSYPQYSLVDGKLDGDLVTFCIHLADYYGGQANKFRQCFRGRIGADHITFRATNYLDHPRISPVEEKFIARRVDDPGTPSTASRGSSEETAR